jgi:lipid II:glycine glycyltransferase (peptidoglycan interpeptide bridge formation enzyme)
VAKENENFIGFLPFFVSKSKLGTVVNSLPFFGSFGGIISNKKCNKEILEFFNKFNKENNVISSVIITNPFLKNFDDYESSFDYDFKDERRIQCINLENMTEEKLWSSFEQRVRRAIRKSMKENISIEICELTEKIIPDFYSFHKNEMDSKNGKSKPIQFFYSIKNNFTFGKDYELYVAKQNFKPISYLLIFYSDIHAEYYMPAYHSDFKHTQSTSLLIWESIKSAIKRNLKFYNFGGTCKNQPELYRFKRGWSSNDYFYNYYIFANIDKIRSIGIENLVTEFPYFYIAPFNKI